MVPAAAMGFLKGFVVLAAQALVAESVGAERLIPGADESLDIAVSGTRDGQEARDSVSIGCLRWDRFGGFEGAARLAELLELVDAHFDEVALGRDGDRRLKGVSASAADGMDAGKFHDGIFGRWRVSSARAAS